MLHGTNKDRFKNCTSGHAVNCTSIDAGKSHRNLLLRGPNILLMEIFLVLLIKSKFTSPGRVIRVLSHTMFLLGYFLLDSIHMELTVTLSLALEVVADTIILLPKVFSERRAIFRGLLHFVLMFNASLFLKWTTLDEWRRQAFLYVTIGNLLPNWLIIVNNRGTVRKEWRNKSRKIQIIWSIIFRVLSTNAYYFKSTMSNRSWDMIDVIQILEWIVIVDMIFGPYFNGGTKVERTSEKGEFKLE